MTKYVALNTVHYNHEESGERTVAPAKGSVVDGKVYHGVFDGLSTKDANALLKAGVIREATRVEAYMVSDEDVAEDEVAEETLSAEPAPKPKKSKDKSAAADPVAEPAPAADENDLGL